MISPILPAHDATTVTLDFGVFIAEQARTHRVSQTAIIAALRPCITPSPDHYAETGKMVSATPSQPETHAPAADTPATQAAGDTTDGGVQTSSLASPSVEPTSEPQPSAEAVQASGTPQGADLSPSDGLSSSLPGAECAEDRAPFSPETAPSGEAAQAAAVGESPALQAPSIGAQPMGGKDVAPPEDTQRTQTLDAAAQGSTLAGETTGSAVGSGAPSPRMSKREQVRACHIEHPDWTSHQIAEHLGFGVQHVQIMASHLSLKLPRAPRAGTENLRDKVLAVIAAHPEWALRKVATEAGCSLGTAAKWAKEGGSKPPEAEKTSDEPQAETAPDQPPVSLPAERLPPPSVRPARSAPSGRFYLRDKTTGHFVHQSLEPNPAGDGPMMTFDRKWAWYDTMERYRGAKKRWPQIEAMRKEASGK